MGLLKEKEGIEVLTNDNMANCRKVFYNCNELPRDQKIIEEEEKKTPNDLPPLKLLEAINGLSTIYAENENPSLLQEFDPTALLCLGMLVEEQLKNEVIGFDEKYEYASDYIRKEMMENNKEEQMEKDDNELVEDNENERA
ncbi:unnamed protein product [Cunninghamella echinulata]